MTRRHTTIGLATVFLASAAASIDATASDLVGKGVKVGLTSATMAGAEPGLTPQTGVAAGAFLTLGLTERWSLQPEILYTEKGAEFESGARPYEYRFSYVEVPLLCRLTLANPHAAFRPNVYAGGFVGFKVGAQIETYRDRGQEEADEVSLATARGF